MDKIYETKYHRLEENHWWFVARRDMIAKLMKMLDIKFEDNILEIGCSGGPLLSSLKRRGFQNVYGVDVSPEAIELCRQRGLKNVAVMDGVRTDFKDGEFELVIAADVLEHIENDQTALTEWHRLLKPGGKLILFAPAFSFLWSGHDDINRHFRRYDKRALTKKLETARFELVKASYWNMTLFLPAFLVRSWKRLFPNKKREPKDQLLELAPLINKMLIGLIKSENLFLRFLDFPCGVSVFAVSKK